MRVCAYGRVSVCVCLHACVYVYVCRDLVKIDFQQSRQNPNKFNQIVVIYNGASLHDLPLQFVRGLKNSGHNVLLGFSLNSFQLIS